MLNYNNDLTEVDSVAATTTATRPTITTAITTVSRSQTAPTTPDQRVTRRIDSPARAYVLALYHSVDLYKEPSTYFHELHGCHHYHYWSLTTPSTGDTLQGGDNSDKRDSRLDIFLMVFPPSPHLETITRIASERLVIKNLDRSSLGE